MSDMGFAGDPGHEGTTRPMDHLQGACGSAPTQMPMGSAAMDNPRSAAPAAMLPWTDMLAPTPHGTGNNDGAEAR